MCIRISGVAQAIADLCAHQFDIFNWFLGTTPKAVTADGGLDYYHDRDWHDNVMAIYEYAILQGTVRVSYQVLTTTSVGGGYFEYFMGTEGALKMSENSKFTRVFREAHAPEWNEWKRLKYIRRKGENADLKPTSKHTRADSSIQLEPWADMFVSTAMAIPATP